MKNVFLYLSLMPMETTFYSQPDQGAALVTQITVVWIMVT